MFNHITGEKLREFRLQSGLSIATAADAVSVTPAFISMVENGKPAPEVQAYRYGMKLDIAKVINVTPPIRACNPVPSRMTYEDSRGNLNTLEYQVMGVCRNNGS